MTRRVLLLGCGAQGAAALHDLVNGDDATHVVVADCDRGVEARVRRYPASRVVARIVDATDEAAIVALMREVDVVVEALLGPFALPMARLAARTGVSLVSSMYLRDPQAQEAGRIAATEQAVREIGRVAKEKGIVILPEFGLDPGLDLILGARALAELDEVEEFHSYGAGIPGPNARRNVFRYTFSGVYKTVSDALRHVHDQAGRDVDSVRANEGASLALDRDRRHRVSRP